MSDHSLKRSFLFCILFLLAAGSAFAATPSGRFEARMVWDPAIHRAVLFGGLTAIDAGTKMPVRAGRHLGVDRNPLDPAFSPRTAPRRAPRESMVFDSARNRVVIFGGRQGKTQSQRHLELRRQRLDADQAPPPRRRSASSPAPRTTPRAIASSSSAAPIQTYSADGKTLTETPLHDTWEFDGTNWTQILADGPAVTKPILEYDPVRKQTIMLGFNDTDVATVMYA